MPVCPYCHAVAKHYGYQCRDNPKNWCKYCNSPDHRSIMCFSKPRVPIKQESEKAHNKRMETTREWFRLNPPDAKGLWYCYLRISPHCPHKLTRSTIQLEHVKSKTRHPELKYVQSNIKPSCHFCNKLKGSFDLEELHLLSVIKLPEGWSWEDVLTNT